jgi:hypothetical protein
MSSNILSEFKQFFESEEAPDIASFAYEDLIGFGIMDSHQYRGDLLEKTKKRGFKMDDYVKLFILVNQVKSLDRLTDQRGMLKQSFVDKYGKETWYDKIMKFLKGDCVMYVAQVKKQSGMSKKFPLVNINTAWPSMAFVAFCYRLHGTKNVTAESDENILEDYLKPEHTWNVQMYNNEALQTLTKIKNKEFWENVVVKSNNTVAGSYEGNKSGEEGKGFFNEQYYRTQKDDQYPFMTMTAGFLTPVPGMKSTAEVVQLIRDFK